MLVLVGVVILIIVFDMDVLKVLIEYMLVFEIQIVILWVINFFFVVDVDLFDDLLLVVVVVGDVIVKMSGVVDVNFGLLFVGLGDKGGDFNCVFVDSFECIVLVGQDICIVLDDQKGMFEVIMQEIGVVCWVFDVLFDGVCLVE